MKGKLKVILLIVSPLLVYFIFDLINTKKENSIVNFGNFYLGVIDNKTSVGNSGDNNIEYYVYKNNERYNFSRLISKPYWLTLQVRDTIIVKAIISDTLTWSIVLEDKKGLIPCLKEYIHPPNGWTELPTNECKK